MIERIGKAIDIIETVIRGKRDTIELVFTAILAGGHCLIEDLPGSGKTLLAKCVARVFKKNKPDFPTFKRIQFTPDLLPSDITGVNVFNPSTGAFNLVRGPIFTNILLADEINRAGPKVQSALLEAMAEGQVTIDNETYRLPDFFFVIATQNPLDIAGTHPLPIAQLDRFLLRIPMSYADPKVEEEIIKDEHVIISNFENMQPVLDLDEFIVFRENVHRVHVCSAIIKAILEVGIRSRVDSIGYGLSTRSLVLLKRAIQAKALLNGRNFATDKDFTDLVFPVLNHRLGLRNLEEARHAIENFSKTVIRNLPSLVVEELRNVKLV
ncbi:MAG: AAA family ATPase [Deltaproteobacteria bacterium]|nr:AAA family ATPase [Deltaproteobacteria bacterium]